MLFVQVVAGKKIEDVGREAVKHVRLPLLSLEEIGQLEEENKKDHFVPVRCCCCCFCVCVCVACVCELSLIHI